MGTKEEYEARKAAAAAWNAEKEQAFQKQPWWFNQRDPINRFTGWLVAWTALLFVGTIVSAAILYKTDITLHQTLIATQRPWVAAKIALTGALTYSDDGVSIPIRADLRNTGQSPALNVFVLWRADTETGTPKIYKGLHILCDPARQFKRRGGDILFPGDRTSDQGSLHIEKKDLAKASARDGYYNVSIYGCVDYLSTLDELHHQTGFVLDLVPNRLVGDKKIYAFNVKAGNVPRSELVLTVLFGGHYAD